MNDLTPLYEYINAQRRAGVNDGTTYHSLLSAGWSPEIASHAMNNAHSPHAQAPAHYNQPQPTENHAVQQAANHQPAQQYGAAVQPQPKGLFAGRLGRSGFLMGNLYVLLFAIGTIGLTAVATFAIDSIIVNILSFLLMLAVIPASFILTFSLYAKRWHDLGQSGWFALFWLAVGVILLIILAIIKGENKPNQYGPQPRQRLTPKAIFSF